MKRRVAADDDHLHNALTGEHLTFLRKSRELLRVQVRLEPGGRVPRHAHARQDEHVRVLAGRVTVRVGGEEHELTPGQSVDVPRRRIHVVRNAGPDEAKFLLEVRPARRMEMAMRALFRLSGVLTPLARRRPEP